MAATIKIKNSSTAGAAPTSSDLVQGELAVNVTDKRLYTENASGTVVELGTNPSVPVTFPDGSASAPSLTNDGDTNTGLFFPAADTVGIATGGTERARIDSSGNLGLGVTPSASWASTWKGVQLKSTPNFIAGGTDLNLISNAYFDGTNYKYLDSFAYASRYYQYNGQHQWHTTTSTQGAGNTISFTQAMTLDASGNLGVGTTSPAAKLQISSGSGGDTTGLRITRTDAGGGDFRIWATGNANGEGGGKLIFGNAANLMTLDGSGNLLVGKTSASYTTLGAEIRASGQILSTMSGSTNSTETLNVYSTGAGVQRFYVGLGGTVYATSTSISAISDATLKENIRDLETGLTEVMALRPRRFDWKNGDAQNVAGFVAQEVEQVLPELVTDYVYNKDEDGNDIIKKSLKMGDILPTLVKAIQEQQAIITQLQADVAALKGQA